MELEPLEVVKGSDLLFQPTPHLHARGGGHEGLDVEVGGKFVPQLLAAAIVDPGIGLVSGEPVRHGGEEIEGLGLGLPVVLGGVIDVGGAGGYRVEGLEGGHQLAATEHLDPQLTPGELGNAPGKALCGCPQARGVLRPGCDEQ